MNQPSLGYPDAAQPCAHDYECPLRKGRARYHCPKCDADISLEVILIAEADWEAQEAKMRAKHRAGKY
jgi:hypothetical protein